RLNFTRCSSTVITSSTFAQLFFPSLFLIPIPPPPRSTLFPYTTLFRSSRGPHWNNHLRVLRPDDNCSAWDDLRRWSFVFLNRGRSEEHTSELQSRGHLVCRLLLEKKKNKTSATLTS